LIDLPSFLFSFLLLNKNLQDKEIRKRLQDSEFKLGSSMPLDAAKERSAQLEAEVTSLERYLQIIVMWFLFGTFVYRMFLGLVYPEGK
jgi:hypothetical protein